MGMFWSIAAGRARGGLMTAISGGKGRVVEGESAILEDSHSHLVVVGRWSVGWAL